MRQFLIFLSFFISSFFANLALAETSGPHISVEKIDIDDWLTGLTGSGVWGVEGVDRGRSNEDDDVVKHELGERLSIDRENVAIDAVSIELGIRVV